VHAVESYLRSLARVHSTGGATPEESYYPALNSLLDAAGKQLKPKVFSVLELKSLGAGHPDFGLYTSRQSQRSSKDPIVEGTIPERGVVEVKGWDDDSFVTAKTDQVTKYWKRYGLVLVTNYRDFVLIGSDDHGQPIRLETYRMVESEADFRALLDHPSTAAQEQGDRLLDFIRRVMLHGAPLTNPEDLAWFLASYAREARARVEEAASLPALDGFKAALEQALGMKFEGDKGEHFFRATLVQTLFYGVFASWVLWAREHRQSKGEFNWHETAWTLHVPMISSLFSQLATPSKLKPLRVDEVLNWSQIALNRVDRDAFFAKYDEEQTVQYFYEPFLKAYDPELRKDLGVWYTPPEIVKYQVERVDHVLRTELGVADGLADEQVVVLDPCCGTGAYLVETLKRIHQTLLEKGGGAITAQKLKKAASERVFGFEILPAPFVISHLQVGLMLRKLDASFDPDSDERAGIYLTNALTGWEPLEDPKKGLPLPFPELMAERDAANAVKQDAPILVILGNPPYNAFAGTSPDEEGGLVDTYKEGLTTSVKDGGWGIKKFNLDDLYIRFFRIAERRIARSGKGVVCYISNFSYLSEKSFVVMRHRLLSEFDELWFDCMNGDSRETGKVTPDGKPDPSVFSTDQNKAGIRKGTSIGLMVRKERRSKHASVRFQHFWGVNKRQDLLGTLQLKRPDRKYDIAKPSKDFRYSFKPLKVSPEYREWPTVAEFSSIRSFNGPYDARKEALYAIERDTLVGRMMSYYDNTVADDGIRALHQGLMTPKAGFRPTKVRRDLLATSGFSDDKIYRMLFKPLDSRYYYCELKSSLCCRPSPNLMPHVFEGNSFLVTRSSGVASPEGSPIFYSSQLVERDEMRGHARLFPIRIRQTPKRKKKVKDKDQIDEMGGHVTAKTIANLSRTAREYLAKLGITNPDKDAHIAGLIWMHALAIGYSPAYLSENADGIRMDWPRIPLPKTKKALLESSSLGSRIAALLDTEKPVEGVTTGRIEAVLQGIATVEKVGGGSLDPKRGEFDLTPGWGHAGKGGICMPGRGRLETRQANDPEQVKSLGEPTCDVFLNDHAYWANIPQSVWDYHIGGYQVIKKWLSYREKSFLGRALKMEEIEYVTEMARRIAALIILQPDLDANYEAVKAKPYSWSGSV
jgi:hypothetical protein